ncbi:MAG: FtsX-like permease family protein [Bacteroidaceae bacterium]|nr:FtsX-like permease family protein [Bacteroidaceae bacterium]
MSTKQSRKHYRRFYRLVTAAVILMMAVLTGSLLLGDSVRGTLVHRVSERLGKTETVITSGTGFMNETLVQHPLMKNARGYLLMDGFVSVGEKLLPVYVWGTDADTLQEGEVMVNEPLLTQLGNQEDLVLHLPSHHLVPSGSLFVTKSYATQMRLHVVGVKSVEEGGNLLLKNEQTLPLNVFVNRQHLAEKMELEGKINMVLSDDFIEEEQLAACWTPEQSGIHLTDSTLTCDGVFIPLNIVEKLGNRNEELSTLYLSYFVNDLIHNADTIPYSFVTAVNEWQGEPLEGQDIILSDYAARRLHVQEGDSVSMSYFITRQLKNLDTRAQMLRVKKIVPLASFRQDSLLMADFPGLTRVENCTDWDSDLPIDMNRVQKEDEDFWHTYRQTPKAVVSYEAVKKDWSNAFGSATAMRFTSRPEVSWMPHDADVQLYHPRAQGLKGAAGGVDFAGLFLSLGFFIILSSVLLMKNPLVEMFTQRQGEIQLYQQLGFKDKDIRKGLFKEAFTVMLFASPWGALAGFAYSTLTLWLLGNVWSGATHTEGFVLHVQPLTLIIGVLIGLLICALTLWWVIRSQLSTVNSQFPTVNSQLSTLTCHLSIVSSILLLLTISLIVVNFIYLHNMVLFIVCGLLWILTWGLFLRREVERRSSTMPDVVNRKQLIRQSVRASLKQHLLAYWTLSLGVFTVFAVGLNRPDFTQALQATGGYQFYVDSRVPIQYDLNNPSVRHKLSLQSLPDSTTFLGFLRHTQDEASCLNLNQVSTPTVLGVDLKEMEAFGLIPDSQLSTANCQLYLDEEALTWSLMKSVGDTLFYQSERGDSVPVVIAGTYPTGIFHGNAIMSSEVFRRLWPKEGGQEVLLMKSSRPEEAAEILSMAMNEYGLNVQTVEERIKMFFEVTETYLIIFLTLGGLGLLLGIFSLMIIVRKNLTAQRSTIRQYRATGFPEPLIRHLLLHENLLVPFYAICVGAIGSIISISANPGGAGLTTLLLALVVLVVIFLLLYYGVKYMVNQTINNQKDL